MVRTKLLNAWASSATFLRRSLAPHRRGCRSFRPLLVDVYQRFVDHGADKQIFLLTDTGEVGTAKMECRF